MTQETTLHIVGTDLLDYSFKVEKAIKEGYTFSDLNEYAPRAWPHMFEAWMLKDTEDNTLLSPKDEEGKLKVDVETPVKPSELLSVESKDASQGSDTKKESENTTANSDTVVAEKTTKQVTRRGKK